MSLEVTFLTHGAPSAPYDDRQSDRTIELSAIGAFKARDRRRALGRPNFQMVLHLPALYAKQTAISVAGLEVDARTIEVPELALHGKDSVDVHTAIMTLGNVPYYEYLKSVATARAMAEFGRQGNYAIKNIIGAVPSLEDKGKVLIIGKRILLQAICFEMCFHSADLRQIGECILENCEGFTLKVNHENETTISKLEK